MLVLPCGFGKTVVALSLVAKIAKKTIVVINKDFLLEQWRERINSFIPDCKVGIIKGRKAEIEGVDIVLATVQTVASRPPMGLEKFGFMIIDEAHHMAARFFSKLFSKVPCRHVLGLTATPERKDGCTRLLHLYMGDISFEKGVSCSSTVTARILSYTSRSGMDLLDREGNPLYSLMKSRLVEDQTRNKHIVNVIRGNYVSDRISLRQSRQHFWVA